MKVTALKVLIILCCVCTTQVKATRYTSLVDEIEQLMQNNVYNKAVLDSEAFSLIQANLHELAKQSKTDKEFIDSFNQRWKKGPFSHVQLQQSAQSSTQFAKHLDAINVGDDAVQLSFNDDVAILTVNTMMGNNTIEFIKNAYQRIDESNPRALIIDLRKNQGGAFAIVPLVEHLLQSPLDAGVFLSRKYYDFNTSPPNSTEVSLQEPWREWSLLSFWQYAADNAMTRVLFNPQRPTYKGLLYVLISHTTASAAELAAEAMQASGRATLVGEKTAGAMLSQKPYDLSNGWIIFLPFADYVSKHSGSLEGKGIHPDIETSADQAMDRALSEIIRSSTVSHVVKPTLPLM
jgi:carboxyl-terminal processing protease